MKKVGLVGWRGMVGSVLMQRMQEEQDFSLIEPVFFTTSQTGQAAPNFGKAAGVLKDANSIAELSAMDIIISCQGGDYTTEIFPKLRASGWNGYWIDAASTLRMEDDAVIPRGKGTVSNYVAAVKKYRSRITSNELYARY
jgi:aspartate-semialdehyde dehydrogenase